MKNSFVITVTGPDHPGIIKELAHTTNDMEGEWVRSKMTRLGGQFTALIQVSIDEDKASALTSTLEKGFPALLFASAELKKEKKAPTKKIVMEIDGKDRPELIHDINNLLMSLELEVEHMEAHRFEVGGIGMAVFSAKLELVVPEAASSEAIVEEIEMLADDLRVSLI